ncbi:MAG: hypothetical protein QOD69_435 [Solirubrobacteraceae bacterium]|nr:hypothetical protein [Solirubrobacteraceae bacterium]
MIGFGFASGGFLPGPVALAATVLAVVLVVRLTAGRQAWGAVSAGYVAGAAALALFAGWVLLSGTWSGAPARALVEYDRALLYLLGFLVAGSLGSSPARLRWALRGLAAAAFAVCLCALVTRVAPDVWPVGPGVAPERLSYPLGYWNALGLLAAIAIVLAFALTCDDRESPVVRVLGAAALPVLGATLLLTFSRGAIAAGAAGIVVLLVAGRPRALLTGALVAVPAVAVAAVSAYGADLLASTDPATPAAAAQGHRVALVVAVCTVLAAGARAALLGVDRRLDALRLPGPLRRPAVRAGAAGGLVAVALGAALALGLPGAVQRQYDRFVEGNRISGTTSAAVHGRLTNPGNNGRIDAWRIALEDYRANPLQGSGAGTYALEWDRRRPVQYQIEDGHSLYVEVLGELGIVGFVLVVAAVLLVLGGFAAHAEGPDRVVGAALLAAGVAWALHAGVDWDWEMPAVTFWLFAAGGLALAAPADAVAARAPAPLGRIVLALGCLVLALVPARLYLSDGPLRDSARAFARGDCPTTIDRALDATSALGVRPEPFVLLGYCDVRVGRPDLAVRALSNAVRKDPDNWEGHYGLALVRAAAGEDPRSELRVARRLNPREPLVSSAQRLFATADPRAWRRRAQAARLPES